MNAALRGNQRPALATTGLKAGREVHAQGAAEPRFSCDAQHDAFPAPFSSIASVPRSSKLPSITSSSAPAAGREHSALVRQIRSRRAPCAANHP